MSTGPHEQRSSGRDDDENHQAGDPTDEAAARRQRLHKNLPMSRDLSAGLTADLAADLNAGLLESRPEDELPRRLRGPLDQPPRREMMHPALILYLTFLLASITYWRYEAGQWLWASQQAVLGAGEYWRLFTALFTHSDITHWLANGPLFLIFGWYLRAYFGRLAFPIMPLLLGALTNLVTIAFYPPATRLIGASGMLYAMVALWICFYIRFDVQYRLGLRFLRAIGFSLMVLFPTTFEPQTSYLAHALGFGFGVLGALCLMPWEAKRLATLAPPRGLQR